jgi:DNA-binding NtrC family response regulator
LVVDDDPLIRSAFAGLFAPLGLHWRIASNALEAKVQIDDLAFDADVAIVDFRLPGGTNGLQLLETMIDERRSLAAVLMTGDMDPQLFGRVVAIGAALLNKPFDDKALAAAVGEARQIAARRLSARAAL